MSRHKCLINLDNEIYDYFINDIPLALLVEHYDLSYAQMEYIYNKVSATIEQDDFNFNFSFKTAKSIYDRYNETQLITMIKSLKNMIEKYQFIAYPKYYEKRLASIQNALLSKNIKLVHNCINVFFHNLNLPEEDAVMFGIYGLYEAIEKISDKSKVGFKNYAMFKIIKSIKDNFSELYGIPWNDFAKSKSKREELPILNYDYNQLDNTIQGKFPTTFEEYEVLDELENESFGKLGTESLDYQYYSNLKKDINDVLNKIPLRNKKIIELYFGLNGYKPKKLTQIAQLENVSTSAIGELKNISVNKLLNKELLKKIGDYYDGYDKYIESQKKVCKEDFIIKNDQIYLKALSLLMASVSQDAFQKFMKMAGFDYEIEDIDIIVLQIQEICNIVEKLNYKPELINRELMSKSIFVSLKTVKFICQHYIPIREETNYYIRTYIIKKQDSNSQLQKKPNLHQH